MLTLEVVAFRSEHFIHRYVLDCFQMIVFTFFVNGYFVFVKFRRFEVIFHGQYRYFKIDRRFGIVSTFSLKAGHCVGSYVLLAGDLFDGE